MVISLLLLRFFFLFWCVKNLIRLCSSICLICSIPSLISVSTSLYLHLKNWWTFTFKMFSITQLNKNFYFIWFNIQWARKYLIQQVQKYLLLYWHRATVVIFRETKCFSIKRNISKGKKILWLQPLSQHKWQYLICTLSELYKPDGTAREHLSLSTTTRGILTIGIYPAMFNHTFQSLWGIS